MNQNLFSFVKETYIETIKQNHWVYLQAEQDLCYHLGQDSYNKQFYHGVWSFSKQKSEGKNSYKWKDNVEWCINYNYPVLSVVIIFSLFFAVIGSLTK